MAFHHQYINNECKLESSINEYKDIFKIYINNPPSLKEALSQMFISSRLCPDKQKALYKQIIKKINKHLDKNFNDIQRKYKNITYEDAQIISSYTCELNEEDKEYNLYKILNNNLVANNRVNSIQNISKYLFIFLKALRKLKRYSPENKKSFYRCINTQVLLNYDSFDKKKIPYLSGEHKIFWAFSSASTNPLTSFDFLGKDKNNYKKGTIFSLTGDVWGYDISLFNVYGEEEILLEPEREIEVEESLPPLNNIIYVRCRIKQTPVVLEDILKQKINLNDINLNNDNNINLDLEENLNINKIKNEKNKESISKKKELIQPLSTKNKSNNHIKYDIYNTEPNAPKYSSSTFNNKNKKNLKYSYSQKQFNITDNSNDINDTNNSNKKKDKIKFSFNKDQFSNNINKDNNNQNLNKNEILDGKNNGNINNSNIKPDHFSSESKLKKHTKSLFNKFDKDLMNSNSQKNILSNKKYNTFDDNEIKHEAQNNKNQKYMLYSDQKISESNKIYYGKVENSKMEIAIKQEKNSTKDSQLEHENNIYKFIQDGIGIPKIYCYSSQKNYNYLMMELLDRSLNFYFNSCECKFSLLTTLMLADQMLSLIEFIHEKFLVHCNIKPEHFVMGRDSNKHKVYLVSFKFTKKYMDPVTKMHIPFKDKKGFIGNYNFASINQHLGIEMSRRDDIEALGYIFIYFLKGNLPWLKPKHKTYDEAVEKVKNIKINTSLDSLCQGCQEEFKTFIQYSRNLKYDEKPNYGYLRKLLERVRIKNHLNFNYDKYDWLLKKK